MLALVVAADNGLAGFLAGAIVVAMLGWRDDLHSLPIGVRLSVELLVSILVVAWLGPVTSIQIAGTELVGPLVWTPLAVLALVWVQNLFNFMDGSDGLAATQAVFSGTFFALAFFYDGQPAFGWLSAAVAAAALGFLPWNWPRASIFLGDSGSLLLGWSVGFLALAGTLTGSVSVWLAFIILSPFVVDATMTLGWRIKRREQWYTAHREHAYQQLLRSGWSHQTVLSALIVVNAMVIAPTATVVVLIPGLDIHVALVLGIVQIAAWYLARSRSNRKIVSP
ncbi:MAG: glycosyl transferase [Wenzhouxiangellaceae bacterium]